MGDRFQEKFKLTFERGFESFTEGNGCAQIVSKLQERATNSLSFVKKLHLVSKGFVSHFHPSLQAAAPAPNVPRDSSLEKAPSPTTENVKGSSQKLFFCFQSGRRIIDMNILLV